MISQHDFLPRIFFFFTPKDSFIEALFRTDSKRLINFFFRLQIFIDALAKKILVITRNRKFILRVQSFFSRIERRNGKKKEGTRSTKTFRAMCANIAIEGIANDQ